MHGLIEGHRAISVQTLVLPFLVYFLNYDFCALHIDYDITLLATLKYYLCHVINLLYRQICIQYLFTYAVLHFHSISFCNRQNTK